MNQINIKSEESQAMTDEKLDSVNHTKWKISKEVVVQLGLWRGGLAISFC